LTLFIFKKNLSALHLPLLFSVLIIGIHSVVYFDQIPRDLLGKASFVIFFAPFIFIYLCIEIRIISRYPNILIIDVEKETIDIDSKVTYSFSNIETLIVTLKKYSYAFYLKDKRGKVILKTKDYFETNMKYTDMKEFFQKFDNIHVSYDNS
jgi:hypothetical protein